MNASAGVPVDECVREIEYIFTVFGQRFLNAQPDDLRESRELVRVICCDFVEQRITERLLAALSTCVQYLRANSQCALELIRANRVQSGIVSAVRLLRQASARPDPKCVLIELSVVRFVIDLITELRALFAGEQFVDDVVTTTTGIVANLTQCRFAHGHHNIHLASLVDAGCVPFLAHMMEEAERQLAAGPPVSSRRELQLWFCACNALANLSMEPTQWHVLRPFWPRFELFGETTVLVASHGSVFNIFRSAVLQRHARC
jgi:hypothetical protein